MAGDWRAKKKEFYVNVVQTAEVGGQTVNVDLCFIPESHVEEEKLPAVSGSSGHLVVERDAKEEPASWPGQVFAEELPYEEAMKQYVEETKDRQEHRHSDQKTTVGKKSDWREEWEGREERHRVTEQRKQEDMEWEANKAQHRQAQHTYRKLPKPRNQEQKEAQKTEQAVWRRLREQRSQQMQKRQEENRIWHECIQQRQSSSEDPRASRSWIAALVVIDNATRQCYGLPLFLNGAHVTAKEVVEALRITLPEHLRFLISDQGIHFRNNLMALLAQEKEFSHVLAFRHRPQSNGIAERFVLTFKQWLRNASWNTLDEFKILVQRFLSEYNDRPHQGLEIPGLSPNEYAKRLPLGRLENESQHAPA